MFHLRYSPGYFVPFILVAVIASTAPGTICNTRAVVASERTPRSDAARLNPPLLGSYAALGDSVTYGIGATPHTRGYAYLVEKSLHARHFVDTGIPGITINAGYTLELSSALAIRPSLCTVFFGYNDLAAGVSRSSFLSDLSDMVATLRRAHCQVLVIGLPDLSLVPSAHVPHVHTTVVSWNRGMSQVAARNHAYFLDLSKYAHELATHRNYIAADGLHPSNQGHLRLAQLVAAGILRDKIWRTK
ncbi:MAG TPA: SGNH/GDSL hydrolase family protein [Chloroflexota bacterium]